jgi:hypothetical protein
MRFIKYKNNFPLLVVKPYLFILAVPKENFSFNAKVFELKMLIL